LLEFVELEFVELELAEVELADVELADVELADVELANVGRVTGNFTFGLYMLGFFEAVPFLRLKKLRAHLFIFLLDLLPNEPIIYIVANISCKSFSSCSAL
jgi:hypothetical protein